MQSAQDLRTHLAAMDCELRKEKATTRRYQVATERLLQFVEVWAINLVSLLYQLCAVIYIQNCHEALVKSPDADKIM